MENNIFTAMLSMVLDRGQLQFFIGLWTFVWLFAVLFNNITRKRLLMATSYLAAMFITLSLTYVYRFHNIMDRTGDAPVEPMALILIVFLFVDLGLWTAFLSERLARKQTGWVLLNLSSLLRNIADFAEKNIDVTKPLRAASKALENRTVNTINGQLLNLKEIDRSN